MELPQVFAAAFSLPEENRADLAFQLLQTLHAPTIADEENPGLAEELERRVQAYEAGQTTADDWDTVAARLREELDGEKS